MPLSAPCQPINFDSHDVYGNSVRLQDFVGKKVLLAFFRDAACPFCNLRLYELTRQYEQLQANNLHIIAVFSSPSEDVRRFVARHPRPFTLLSDPNLYLYERYGIQHSGWALVKAILFRMPRIIGGMMKGGHGDMKNPYVKLVPADFLISEQGEIVHTWYGRDTSDHIPMKNIEAFARDEWPHAATSRKTRLA